MGPVRGDRKCQCPAPGPGAVCGRPLLPRQHRYCSERCCLVARRARRKDRQSRALNVKHQLDFRQRHPDRRRVYRAERFLDRVFADVPKDTQRQLLRTLGRTARRYVLDQGNPRIFWTTLLSEQALKGPLPIPPGWEKSALRIYRALATVAIRRYLPGSRDRRDPEFRKKGGG